jgi:hypothetical protein
MLSATAVLAVPPAAAFAQSGRTEYFTAVATGSNPGNSPGPIIAHGAFTAVGVDHPGDLVDTIVFPNGTFKFDHSQAGGTATFTFNPITCIETFKGTGLPFTLKDGTGNFTGISGRGTFNITVTALAARNPDRSCSDTTTVAGYAVMKATGTVSFGG